MWRVAADGQEIARRRPGSADHATRTVEWTRSERTLFVRCLSTRSSVLDWFVRLDAFLARTRAHGLFVALADICENIVCERIHGVGAREKVDEGFVRKLTVRHMALFVQKAQ